MISSLPTLGGLLVIVTEFNNSRNISASCAPKSCFFSYTLLTKMMMTVSYSSLNYFMIVTILNENYT